MKDFSRFAKTAFHMDWFHDLAPVITEAWSATSRVEMEETPNDTDYTCSVKKGPLSKYDLESLTEAKAQGGFMDYYLELVMTDLANQDIVPEGNYVVRVCW